MAARATFDGPAAIRAPGFALFDYGFRPFFLLAGAYGAVSILAWLALYLGLLRLPLSWPEVIWHGHEMVFGFAAAGVAGFMLTAVPSWTGAAPVRGGPLMLLAGLWLAGRVALWTSAALPPALVAAADLALLPAVGLAVARPLIAHSRVSGARNVVFLALLALLTTANLLTHLDTSGVLPGAALPGLYLGIDTLLLMIVLVGGRIVPTFTANALRRSGATRLPRSFPALEALAVGSMVAMLGAAFFLGLGPVFGALALVAALANGVRLAFWRPLATLGTPLLWVLHLGYAWLVLGLVLGGTAALTDAMPATAALHALTAGAIGTMLLAVMSRAALGHTGRPLAAAPLTVAAYGLLSLGAALRVAAPLLADWNLVLLAGSGVVWAAAMVLFVVVYAPILVQARVDAGRVPG